MANYVLTDGYCYLNSIDMSADTKSIAFSLSVATVDNTNMGDNDMNYLPGLKGGDTVSLVFSAENTDAGTSEDLWDIYYANVAVECVLASQGSSIGVTNPFFTFDCIMTSLGLIEGSVGDQATHSVTLQISGAVARTESA